MKSKNENKKIASSVIYNTIGSGCYLFVQWLILYIVLWISGFKQEGMLSAVMSVSAVFYAISLFGMRNYQSTDLDNNHSEKTYVYSRIVTCGIALVGGIAYCLILKYNLYMTLCVMTYLFFKFSEAIADVFHGTLQKKWLFKIIGISFIIRAIVSLISFSITLWISKSLLLSIIAMGISCLLSIFIFDYKQYIKSVKKLGQTSWNKLKQLLWICLPLAIYMILSNYALSYPKIAIGKILGNKMLGYYTTYANPAMIIQVAATYIVSPLITYFAEIYKSNKYKDFFKLLTKCLVGIIGLTFIALLMSKIFGIQIFSLLFGKKILKYYYLFNQVIIISMLTAIMWLLGGIITVLRRFKPLIIINLFYVISVMIFSNQFIRMKGLIGANLVIISMLILTNVCYFVYIVIFLKRHYNLTRGGKK